jgi:ribosomal subunit interface protein
MAINLEIHLDHLQISETTQTWIESRLEKLEKGHADITGAHLSVKQLSGKPTVNEYEATLTLYHKPDNISASQKSPLIPEAIQLAYASTERQLRKARGAARDRRKRSGRDAPVS